MKIIVMKTKVMGIAKGKNEVIVIREDQKLEHVDSFKYLGSVIIWNRRCTEYRGYNAVHRSSVIFANRFRCNIIIYPSETCTMKNRE